MAENLRGGGYILKGNGFYLWIHAQDTDCVSHTKIPQEYADGIIQNEEKSSLELTDYKFFCFDGYVDCVMVCVGRSSGDTRFYFFNKEWRLLRLNIRGRNAPENFTLPKPKCIGEMFSLAEKLSKGCPYIRIDLYESCGRVYFGEMTFYPQSGFDANLLPETDKRFGELIQLPGLEGM